MIWTGSVPFFVGSCFESGSVSVIFEQKPNWNKNEHPHKSVIIFFKQWLPNVASGTSRWLGNSVQYRTTSLQGTDPTKLGPDAKKWLLFSPKVGGVGMEPLYQRVYRTQDQDGQLSVWCKIHKNTGSVHNTQYRYPFLHKCRYILKRSWVGKYSLVVPVLWIQIHWIWTRIQDFGPICIRIQSLKKVSFKRSFF